MVHSKTIDILKELSKKEFIQFGRYLSSGAFTSNKNLLKLPKKAYMARLMILNTMTRRPENFSAIFIRKLNYLSHS